MEYLFVEQENIQDAYNSASIYIVSDTSWETENFYLNLIAALPLQSSCLNETMINTSHLD